ncbi:hypothetical protein [Bacillus cereus]|uniref:hypothetical protein n=1 Tax=Bacillus cereus TaxID=1396 RepID=UPI000BF33EB1|nr:hypothetical protein [Bacillus cereus]PFA06613.1 hypothetical protein CN382_25740 [Bacillus cereus]
MDMTKNFEEIREQCIERLGVLEKVKKILLLPKDAHASTEKVAELYGVSVETINLLIEQHYDELKQNGMAQLKPKGVAIFPRRAIINAAMLLESAVAREVQTQLLNIAMRA